MSGILHSFASSQRNFFRLWAVTLYYFSYNFIMIHRTLRITPAMQAGVTNRLWDVSELVAILEAKERYRPRKSTLFTSGRRFLLWLCT